MGAIGWIEIHQNRTDARSGVLEDDPFGAVRTPDADAVTAFDADREQGSRQFVDARVEFGVGQPDGLIGDNECVSFGKLQTRRAKVVTNRLTDQWTRRRSVCV
jgi:hypothetical protein